MRPLRLACWGLLAQRLQIELGVRTAWVQYSNNGKGITVLVTVFDDSGYRMYFGRNVRDFTYQTIRSFVTYDSGQTGAARPVCPDQVLG